MLRKKKADEYWTLEEVLEEQLAFQKHDGTLALMYHSETDKPYLAKEMCEEYHQNKLKESSDNVEKFTKSENNNFHRGHRKSKFTQEQKSKIYTEFVYASKSKCELARIYGCSEKTIRNIIKEFG